MVPRLRVVLLASFISLVALSQSLVAQTSSPVAYVYVSRPTHLDGFAASSSGRLTPVPGSPFSGIAASHLSVTNKFLFGASDDNQTIYTYSIAGNGSVKKVAAINTHNYDPDGNVCFSVGPTQIDYTRTTLYNDDWNCYGASQYVQSYKIETNGQLTFLGNSGGESEDWDMGPPVVLGTNKYLYAAGTFNEGQPGGVIQEYQRQTNGAMDLVNSSLPCRHRRPAPQENTDNWPITEATTQSVNKVIGSGRGSYPFDVGDFSYVVNDEYYSGRATISRSFSTGDSQPRDLVDKKFQVRYNPRKPDKYDLSQSDAGGFLLDPYDDFLMHDIGPTDIVDN